MREGFSMEKAKQRQLLKIIEKDCRLNVAEVAIMLGLEEPIVAAELKRLEENKIIAGYRALVNWDKVEDDWIEALVEVSMVPTGEDGYRKVAQQIKSYQEVESLFFISGGFDFIVLLQGRNIKDISRFISTNLASIPEVSGTRTHFLLDKYKEWGIDLTGNDNDPRMRVSP